MGGQPWSELELHGRPWGAHRSGEGWGRGRGERREKKKGKKEKNMEKFSNLKIFGEKNKRQFMKLEKIIFVQEMNKPNYN
jgi:hypothetical protein